MRVLLPLRLLQQPARAWRPSVKRSMTEARRGGHCQRGSAVIMLVLLLAAAGAAVALAREQLAQTGHRSPAQHT